MRRRFIQSLFTAFILLLLSRTASLAADAMPDAVAHNRSLAGFWSGDFFTVLQQAKQEHKPIFVLVNPLCLEAGIALTNDLNRRALEPFLKTRIPWTKEETDKLPLSEEQKKQIRGLIEEGGGHLGWPTALYLDENGKRVHVGSYFVEGELPYDLAAAYKALNMPVPPYLEAARKASQERIETKRMSYDGLTDFWSGEYSEVLERAQKENKPVFVASVPMATDFTRDTLKNAEVQAALLPFLKTRMGVRDSERIFEDALNQGFIGDHGWPLDAVERDARRRKHSGCMGTIWPAWVFLNSNGAIVHKFNGWLKADAFLKECKIAQAKLDAGSGLQKP